MPLKVFSKLMDLTFTVANLGLIMLEKNLLEKPIWAGMLLTIKRTGKELMGISLVKTNLITSNVFAQR